MVADTFAGRGSNLDLRVVKLGVPLDGDEGGGGRIECDPLENP